MAYISLDDICSTIDGYDNALAQHGFEYVPGGGRKAWSILHAKDNMQVEVRASEWTLYVDDEEIAVGHSFNELDDYLRDYNEYTSFNLA